MADDFDDQDFDFEDYDDNVQDDDIDEGGSEEGGSNRSFLIMVGVLGIVLIFAFICLAVFYFLRQNDAGGGRAVQLTEAALAYAQQTQLAQAATQTAIVEAFTDTPTVTPTSTATQTPTEVVALSTPTVDGTSLANTATVAALLTQAATVTPGDITTTPLGTVTVLPTTGFADDLAGGGLLGLIGLAAIALVIIFLARRLRTATE